jgi:hypothetical protein
VWLFFTCKLGPPLLNDVFFNFGEESGPFFKVINPFVCIDCLQQDQSQIEYSIKVSPKNYPDTDVKFVIFDQMVIDWSAARIEDAGDYKITVTGTKESAIESCTKTAQFFLKIQVECKE